jgi:hypothetical protein
LFSTNSMTGHRAEAKKTFVLDIIANNYKYHINVDYDLVGEFFNLVYIPMYQTNHRVKLYDLVNFIHNNVTLHSIRQYFFHLKSIIFKIPREKMCAAALKQFESRVR